MSKPLVIIPARINSKGIKHKNFRPLVGVNPTQRAINVARAAGLDPLVSTDCDYSGARLENWYTGETLADATVMRRPKELATDESPMIDVVRHVLEQIPGPPDQKIALLQPTQPLRTPAHVQQALEALTDDWNSVMTITPIPRTHAPSFALMYCHATLSVGPWMGEWRDRPVRRQDVPWPYIADGTAYVFWRKTVGEYGNLYGACVRGLIIPASETCALDTPEDWADAERRLRDRERA